MQQRTYLRRLNKMPAEDRAEFEAWAVQHLVESKDRLEFFRFNAHYTLTRLKQLHSIAKNTGSSRVGYFKAAVLFKKTTQKAKELG